MQRTVHAHVGPTNSGKTHSALASLRASQSGVYCGPLRLLAWEVHDRLSTDGVPCTLRTGQETREVAGAEHTACTIEMCALHRPVAVGVLDEIQMLHHPERGWAWSRALLGLPAEELHVCGSADALPLLRSLVETCGDELIEHSYERLTPLHCASAALDGDLRRVRAGDCLVAFSRREIYQLKAAVEEATQLTCGVVYGSLPPETRREQARLFNDPDAPEEVLVASDAVRRAQPRTHLSKSIEPLSARSHRADPGACVACGGGSQVGMGLNLNIQRVVFASLSKFDGTSVRPLEPTMVKQIAGRAGRYNSRYGASGEVTCLRRGDLPQLRRALAEPLPSLQTAGLAPTFEQLQSFDRASGHALPFSELLRAFEESARVDKRYFCVSLDPMVRVAEVVDDFEMSLLQRHTFCMAPMDARDGLHASLLHNWARDLARGRPVRIRYAPPKRPPDTHMEMQQLESYFRALDGYLWLAQRFPEAFGHADKVREYVEVTTALIEQAVEDPPMFQQQQQQHASGGGKARGKPRALKAASSKSESARELKRRLRARRR